MEARGVSHVGGAMSSVCRTERSCPRVLTPDERRRPAEGTRPHGVNRRLRAPEKPTSNQDLTGQTDPWPGRGGAERNMHEPGPRRWSPHRGRRSGAQDPRARTHAHAPTRTDQDPRAQTHAHGPTRTDPRHRPVATGQECTPPRPPPWPAASGAVPCQCSFTGCDKRPMLWGHSAQWTPGGAGPCGSFLCLPLDLENLGALKK